ncbi:lytic transglycosylase [Chryseobacterium sp. SL1]|uniref:lytic transglycosylase n=1 Tax=Chryseobacterium sp. SL1 TaxID=2995159 RepID=UPI002272ED52|nr:LysM peptidoglycan-binding domain-containing protein [Chryseobacterium sp. SL1]MCY1660981.1 LysM peptidoglycan-binding domain-containing protein [Chryseobacterium sp. SL1]
MKNFLILFSLLSFLIVSSQTKYAAKQGDSMYSIAVKNGLTVDELLDLNPSFKDKQLKIGDVMIVKNEVKKSQFGLVNINCKQKISEIAKQYNISENDLRLLNPNIDSQLKSGGKITMPLDNIVEYEVKIQKAWEKSMTITKKEEIEKMKQEKKKQLVKIILNPNLAIQNIADYYNISEVELRKLNPNLESRLKVEGEITLPIENIKTTKKAL